MIDLQRLENIEANWKEITNSYRIAPYLAPTRYNAEEEKFFKERNRGNIYNPQFTYRAAPEFPINALVQFMRNLEPELNEFEDIYWEKCRNTLLAIEMVTQRAPSVITAYSTLVYGLPTSILHEHAMSILQQKDNTSRPTDSLQLDTHETIKWVSRFLELVELPNWKAVEFAPMNARIAVNRKDKAVKIRKGTSFSVNELKRLILHEVGVHVFRAENGDRQKVRLLVNGFPGYLSTEEGLAAYNERRAGLLTEDTLRKYAARVLAVHLALNHSFAQTFEIVQKYLDPELAFRIVARVKRGITDTEEPGAYTKDVVYLKGLIEVEEFLETHPEEYATLFVGKVGINDLPVIRRLAEEKILAPPIFLPSQLETLLDEFSEGNDR